MPPPPPPAAAVPLVYLLHMVFDTVPSQKKKKKPTRGGGGKASYFVRPEIWFRSSGSWKTKSKRRGRAGRQTRDGLTSVSANSPNNLQPPTEVSPFIVIERGACTMEPNLITLVREIRTAVLTAEWTWDIRFQSSSLWFFCAHRFKAHTGLVCVIYHQTSHFLRRRLCAGFCPSALEVCSSHPLRVSLHPRGAERT